MKKRSFLIVLTAVLVSVCIGAGPAWAGNVQRNRWEGLAIGIGAAVLGGILLNHYQSSRQPPDVSDHSTVYRERKYRRPERPSGHWETRKVWVPPRYKKVWNPGHYSRKGRWVAGRWIKIEKRPGYWKRKRIWVSDNDYRHRHHD